MIFSIIINTHNQYDLINRCIDSCLKQDFNDDYEIIISDTSDIKKIKRDSKNNVKIKLIETDSFSNFPCVDQMFSIQNALKYASGNMICLLDGDDFYESSKLSFLNKNFSQNSLFLNQDKLVGFNETLQKEFKINNYKKYKENKLFNKFFNSWPHIAGTSSITVDKETIDNFFSEVNPNKWNFLAIDALLIIYCSKIKPITSMGENLTYKSFHNLNLDGTYSNKFSKNYWIRRHQQHDYYQFIHKKKYINIDSMLSKIFSGQKVF